VFPGPGIKQRAVSSSISETPAGSQLCAIIKSPADLVSNTRHEQCRLIALVCLMSGRGRCLRPKTSFANDISRRVTAAESGSVSVHVLNCAISYQPCFDDRPPTLPSSLSLSASSSSASAAAAAARVLNTLKSNAHHDFRVPRQKYLDVSAENLNVTKYQKTESRILGTQLIEGGNNYVGLRQMIYERRKSTTLCFV